MNGRIYDRILDEALTGEIVNVIEESEFYGMQTFDQSILNLYEKGQISFQNAVANASNPHDFRVKAEQRGLITV